jgi:hypothetical protein
MMKVTMTMMYSRGRERKNRKLLSSLCWSPELLLKLGHLLVLRKGQQKTVRRCCNATAQEDMDDSRESVGEEVSRPPRCATGGNYFWRLITWRESSSRSCFDRNENPQGEWLVTSKCYAGDDKCRAGCHSCPTVAAIWKKKDVRHHLWAGLEYQRLLMPKKTWWTLRSTVTPWNFQFQDVNGKNN